MKGLDIDVSQILAPLIIGVTGHRNLRLADYDALSRQVRSVLLDLKRQLPSTPLVLLSPLAEGADRLVANVALEPEIDARLIVPMPLPRHVYEEDFRSPESMADFNLLLARADHSFDVGLGEGNSEEGLRDPAQRDRQYEAVGKFIARESQVLIALWDGLPTQLVGGTAQIVRFRTEGVADDDATGIDPPEGFPVCHILTPRDGQPPPAGYPREPEMIYPDAFNAQTSDGRQNAQRYFGRMFGRLDTFNRLVSQRGPRSSALAEGSKRGLFSAVEETALPGELRVTLHRFAHADALAIEHQRLTNQAQLVVHASVFLAFLCFVLFAHMPHVELLHLPLFRWVGWLFLASVFFAVGLGFYSRATRAAVDTSHQDYRAVAEGMRVQLFWRLVGVRDDVMTHYLRKHRTELDWIRNELRGWRLTPGQAGDDSRVQAVPLQDRVRLALDRWVDHQRRYFASADERERSRSGRLERLTTAGAGAAAGLTIVMGTAIWAGVVEGDSVLVEVGLILIEAFLALSAITHHYIEKMAFLEHAKQYGQMTAIFGRAGELVREAMGSNDLAQAQASVRRLGREALEENGDWVLLHRERPLEMPHP